MALKPSFDLNFGAMQERVQAQFRGLNPNDPSSWPALPRYLLCVTVTAAVVLALWAVWALSIRNGYALMLQYFVGTIVVALLTRLVSMVVLSLIDRGFRIKPEILQRFPGLETRANRYLPMLRRVAAFLLLQSASLYIRHSGIAGMLFCNLPKVLC